jgi:hypothetical protein
MSSIAAMKANATIGPTPGTLIRRQHTGERRANSLSCSSSRAIWPSIAANVSSSAVTLAWSMLSRRTA